MRKVKREQATCGEHRQISFLFQYVLCVLPLRILVGDIDKIIASWSLGMKQFFSLVPQMLAMMVDLEEDEDWANADELEDDDFDR